jgi:hypothetical protein
MLARPRVAALYPYGSRARIPRQRESRDAQIVVRAALLVPLGSFSKSLPDRASYARDDQVLVDGRSRVRAEPRAEESRRALPLLGQRFPRDARKPSATWTGKRRLAVTDRALSRADSMRARRRASAPRRNWLRGPLSAWVPVGAENSVRAFARLDPGPARTPVHDGSQSCQRAS